MTRYPKFTRDGNQTSVASCDPCRVLDCAVFSGITPVVSAEIDHAVRQQEFVAGDRLALDGGADGPVAVIAVGSVRIQWILGDGRRQWLGFGFRGDVLQQPIDAPGVRIVAISNGILYWVERTFFGRCREHRQGVDRWEVALAEDRLAKTTAQAMVLGRLTAKERMALFLRELHNRIGEPSVEGTVLSLPMNREDITDYLGLNSETVSRQLSRMKAASWVRMAKPGEFIVRAPEKLAEAAPISPGPPPPMALEERDQTVA